jgi:ribonuclease R
MAAVEKQPSITVAVLADSLRVTREARDAFSRRVDAMLRDGELILKHGGRLASGIARTLETGKVSRHRDGFGFIMPDAGGDDLYVPPHSLDGIMHGDTVAFARRGFDRRGRQEARVVEVRDRADKLIVGRLARDGTGWCVVPQDRNFSQPLALEKGTRGREGDFVSVEITRYPEGGSPALGRIAETLGAESDAGIEIEVALRKHDLPHVFNPAALAEAAQLPDTVRPRDITGRRDLRDLPLVTIDGEDARDFDDAVYCAPVRNIIGRASRKSRLVVAIADVSHYVKPGTPLDDDARERSTSVYFPRRVIPMLPEKISNGLCSLNPQVDRLVMVCDMVVGPTGNILKYEFYQGVMHSRARLTYTQVAAMLGDPKGPMAQEKAEVLPHLQMLHRVYKLLLGARAERGAVDFESTETRMVFNDAGRIERIVPVVRNEAHKLIEECMLAANVCAADFLEQHKHDALYRIHAGPTPVKLENLRAFLGPLSLSLGGGDSPHAQDYARLAESVKGRPDAGLISSVMLRSMQQAQYSPDNIGHFGLAYEKYAHFTSPIRRYPDLLVHRAIKAVLKKRKYHEPDWEALGIACSQAERRADEASREVQSWLKCQYAAEHLGAEFEGSISGVAGFGIFVTLDNLLIDGMIHISDLGRDYYVFDETRHVLRGERSGSVYALGQRVRVRIARADPDALKIDLSLVEESRAGAPIAPAAGAPHRGDRDGRKKSRNK